MKKKISMLLSLICAVSACGSLAGCGGEEKGGTLLWYCIGDTPADNAQVLAKANEIIEPAIGMKLDIQYIDTASFTEKMKLKMASGEAYDLTFTGYINQYQTAVNLGGLYDITELCEEVGMSDVIPQFYMDSAMVNGRIYGIPNIQVVSNPNCFVMDKALAEECGIDMAKIQELALAVKTLDDGKAYIAELTNALAKIKEKHPELYPINPSGIGGNPDASVYESLYGGVWARKDGSPKLEISYKTDLWNLGVQTSRDWYVNGYVRSDIASKGNTLTTNEEILQVAIGSTTWKPGQDIYFMNNYGYEPVYAFKHVPYVSRTSTLATMISVGANTKHPKEAVQFLKLINENKELYNLICWGIQDQHYTVDEEGYAEEIADSGYNGIAANAWRYGNQFNSYVMKGNPVDVWEQTEKMNNEAMKSPMLGFVPNTDPITNELANLTNIDSEYKARVEFGTEDPAVWLDEYIQKREQAGQKKVLDELQKQYDEFNANK